MDRVRRSGKASPVLIAVGPKDKENISSPAVFKGKSPGTKRSFKSNSKLGNKNVEMIKNQINNLQSEKVKKPITAEDLTTTGNPGEGYWEQLSESRRLALEETWKENLELNKKIMELEYENTKLKAMLSESSKSIKLLTELLDENESGDEETWEEDEEEENQPQDDSLDDASFTSI